MDELNEARGYIDAVDKEMAQLFCRRMEAVEKVVTYKRAHDMPVLDTAREQAVIEKNVAYLPNEQYAPYFTDFMRHVMALSRAYQKSVLGQNGVAYQGVEGAFSHIALRSLFPHAEAKAYATWGEVFDAVENHECAFGVVPFENSQAGDVAAVLDLCYAHKCYIHQMVDLPVHQNLLCLPGAVLSDIKQVYSHQQAISQCARFLSSIGIKATPMDNTAMAAKAVAEAGDKTCAAIASRQTAQLYGLQVLAADINTAATNTTRFIVIGAQPPQGGSRFSLLFTVKNEPGSLARAIDAIAALGYNMESIKSRPITSTTWEYYFYAELMGSLTDDAAARLTDTLQGICSTVRILGTYDKTIVDD